MTGPDDERLAWREFGLAQERHDWEQTEPLLRLGRALADPLRLRILNLLAGRSMFGQEVAAALGVTPPTISRHLSILKAAGLVAVRRENTFHYYSLNDDGLRRGADLLSVDYLAHLPRTVDREPTPPVESETRSMVEAAYFAGDHLRALPRDSSTRRFVLEKVVGCFAWGRLYSEPEVNSTLAAIFADVASIRRALIDDGIMMREKGTYWLTRPHGASEGGE